ncbi:hypothetical protein FB451DRAFT_1190071 [Mycena latifolia]|nr:hypothetical protein FB451DRAFT_1190071 [Mycena latifolia]
MFRSIDSSSNYRIRPRRWWRAIFDTIFRVPASGVARPVRRAGVHEHKFKRDISRSAQRSRVEINASVLNAWYRIPRSHYTFSSTPPIHHRLVNASRAPSSSFNYIFQRPASRATRSTPCTTFNNIFGVPARHLEIHHRVVNASHAPSFTLYASNERAEHPCASAARAPPRQFRLYISTSRARGKGC